MVQVTSISISGVMTSFLHNTLDTGRKLNVHEMFKKRCLMNAQFISCVQGGGIVLDLDLEIEKLRPDFN